MSAEIIATLVMGGVGLGVVVGLTALILTTNRGLRQGMGRMESRLNAKIDALAATCGDLARRTSHMEGVIEGLKVAVAAPRENPKRISE